MGWLERQIAEEEGARSVIDENIKYIRRDHILKQIRRWKFIQYIHLYIHLVKSYTMQLIFPVRSSSPCLILMLSFGFAFFFFFFPASFKPIQRSPWILLCIWPSTSHPHRELRWSVSCQLWRRQPPPSASPASPPCLAEWVQARITAKEAWLSQTYCIAACIELETEAGGANVMALGSCQVTNEPLAMILTKKKFRWLTSIITFCTLSYM